MCIPLTAQETITFGLTDDFQENNNQHPNLVPLPNDSGQTGTFGLFEIPTSTCPEELDVGGYYFEDNAGLSFDNDDFIQCAYTIEFTFNLESFAGPQNWVRLLNVTPDTDNGIYIIITNGPSNGTLEFYPNGTVGEIDFFNTVDLYQFVLTRSCAGLINIYVNGIFFATYDDSLFEEYVIGNGNDILHFFRDDMVVPQEASPGWVKNIRISDYERTPQMVVDDWTIFCDSLSDADCVGVVGGGSILDDCGECLNPDDPLFNQSCADCAGIANGEAIIDECGKCLEVSDPNFGKSCLEEIIFPNVFSPNDDGINDEFSLILSEDSEAIISTYSIYDRWGNLIFNRNSMQPNTDPDWWRGEYNGRKVPSGLYVYVVEIEYSSGQRAKFLGDISVIYF